MKTLITTLLLFLFVNLGANELKWVDEQIKAIKPPRSGISKENVNSIKSPFIFLKDNEDENIIKNKNSTSSSSKKIIKKYYSSSRKTRTYKQSKKPVLSVIINKSALINKKWYKINEKVGKYTLSKISGTSVILTYKNKELLLSTNSKNKNLKFTAN